MGNWVPDKDILGSALRYDRQQQRTGLVERNMAGQLKPDGECLGPDVVSES